MVFNWVPFKTRNLLLYCISIPPIPFLEWTLIRQSVLTWDTKEENPELAEQENDKKWSQELQELQELFLLKILPTLGQHHFFLIKVYF